MISYVTRLGNGVSLSRQFVNTRYLHIVIPKLNRARTASFSRLGSTFHSSKTRARTRVDKAASETGITSLSIDFDVTKKTRENSPFPRIHRNSYSTSGSRGTRVSGARYAERGQASLTGFRSRSRSDSIRYVSLTFTLGDKKAAAITLAPVIAILRIETRDVRDTSVPVNITRMFRATSDNRLVSLFVAVYSRFFV